MKVSIITVCFNSEKYIEQTIQSVLNQLYKDIEYIIIDGMSTDNTLKIISKYKPLFGERLKVISEKDNGIYDAMNKGIKHSNGEILGIINSDDWYELDAVENIIKVYENNKNSIIYGGLLFRRENEISKIQIRSHKELSNGMISHPTVFIPRKLYLQFGLFDCELKIAADYDLMLRMFTQNVSFKYIPKIIANFREGGISMERSKLCSKESLSLKKNYGFSENSYKVNGKENSQSKYLWDILLKNLCENNYKNIYIYGSGMHTKNLIEYINSNAKIQIKGIIDRNVDETERSIWGYNKFNIEEIEEKADAIIISSGSYEYDIYKRIENLKNKIDIIRIYGADSVMQANNIIKDFII